MTKNIYALYEAFLRSFGTSNSRSNTVRYVT